MTIIDIHTHGIGGYDTGDSASWAILKMAEIHGAHDVDVIIPTIYSAPIRVMRENMAAVRKAMEQQRADNSKLKTQNSELPSIISGVHLEGPFLNPSRCGALDPSSFLKPDERTFNKLIDGFKAMVKIITIAPELEGSLNLIKQARDMGINVSMGHSDATYAEAEAGYHAGARGITHIFNAMRGIHHREPGIAGFGLLNQDIFIEVIADSLHLHSETIKMIFAVKNPDRIIIISDSTKETPGLSRKMLKVGGWKLKAEGIRFKTEKLNAKNSKPKTILPSREGLLQGGSATIGESAHRLIDMGYDEKIILKCITENPVQYLEIS
jgi:N-acetylglucosamine-6-phosphate deacetylase